MAKRNAALQIAVVKTLLWGWTVGSKWTVLPAFQHHNMRTWVLEFMNGMAMNFPRFMVQRTLIWLWSQRPPGVHSHNGPNQPRFLLTQFIGGRGMLNLLFISEHWKMIGRQETLSSVSSHIEITPSWLCISLKLPPYVEKQDLFSLPHVPDGYCGFSNPGVILGP